MAQLVKNPPAVQETWVQSLRWEDPLEKGKAPPPGLPVPLFNLNVTRWHVSPPGTLSIFCKFVSCPPSLECKLHEGSKLLCVVPSGVLTPGM